jgi:hypothetical protein
MDGQTWSALALTANCRDILGNNGPVTISKALSGKAFK